MQHVHRVYPLASQIGKRPVGYPRVGRLDHAMKVRCSEPSSNTDTIEAMTRPHPATSVLYRTLRIVESAHLFFTLATLLTAGLFVMGNYQEFLDSSQLLLLQLLSIAGVLCAASGAWYIASLAIWMIRRRRLMLLRFVAALVTSTGGALGLVVAGALQALSGLA